MSKRVLYASAASLGSIESAAKRFFHAEKIELRPLKPGIWAVHTGKGATPLIVKRKGKRYRLEGSEA